jgi:hypothetical protein
MTPLLRQYRLHVPPSDRTVLALLALAAVVAATADGATHLGAGRRESAIRTWAAAVLVTGGRDAAANLGTHSLL